VTFLSFSGQYRSFFGLASSGGKNNFTAETRSWQWFPTAPPKKIKRGRRNWHGSCFILGESASYAAHFASKTGGIHS
jgi:hypothetical protein